MKFVKKVFVSKDDGNFNLVASVVDVKGNKLGFIKYSGLVNAHDIMEEGLAMTPHEFNRHYKMFFFEYSEANEIYMKKCINELSLQRVKM